MQIPNLESLFRQLLDHRDQSEATDFSTLGPWLQHQVKCCRLPDLEHIAFAAATYTRNPIAREASNHNFEALVMRWDKQAKTPIHGHPAFSFYYVMSGIFEMELFTHSATDGLRPQERRLFYSADSIWFWGQAQRYDNFIHRVKCLEPGHTFHVYSEDAQKGVSFQTVPTVDFNVTEAYCA